MKSITIVGRAVAAFAVGSALVLMPIAAFADHSPVTDGAGSGSAMHMTSVAATGQMQASVTCSIARNLTLGSSGDDVTCLQTTLHMVGYLSVEPTGHFGPMTQKALTKWQEAKHLPATGYFGALSRSAFAAGSSSAHPYYQQLEDSHKAMMAAFMSTSTPMAMDMPDNSKVIAVVLYNEFEPLDAIGPLEVLGQLHGYKVVTVAKQKGEVASAFGTKMVADYSFDELKNPAIIVVPGGLFGTIAASKDPATLAWLREADKTSEYTTSVCTGAWILAAAGLLDGRQASTHWTGADYLEDFGVQYTGKRYTVDGKYVTAAGVSAGIDMSFKLVAMIAGEDAAKVAQLGLEYDPQPPFDAGSPAKADPELVKIMRDMMKDHMQAAAIMFANPAMSMDRHEADVHAAGMEMHAHTALDISSWPTKPSIALALHPDSMGGWNLELITQNFRFAPEHVGGAVVANEGHAHLYVDGVKIGRIYGNWYNLPLSLFKDSGTHTVLVTLNANDHSDLSSAGSRIEASVNVTK